MEQIMERLERKLRDRFIERLGYNPDFRNPKTFQEKIHHKMLYDRNPLLVKTADKLSVYDYIKEKGYGDILIPLLWKGTSAKDIPFDDLPSKYVIKPNHASGCYAIIRDGQMFAKALSEEWQGVMDRMLIKDICQSWLAKEYKKGLEWAYTKIKPRLLIQPFIDDGNDQPRDYKFFVFHGRCECIYLGIRERGVLKISLFDRDWKHLDVQVGEYEKGGNHPRPGNLRRMLPMAEDLGKDFDFVRVDLYDNGKIYFGELTHYPLTGFCTFDPPEIGDELSNKWTLPEIEI